MSEKALRAPLIAPLERFATDVAIGRHDDPHTAFVVLCYPNQAPTVLSIIANQSPCDLGRLQTRTPDTDHRDNRSEREKMFSVDDLYDAERAINSARGVISWHDKETLLGQQILDKIAKDWQRHRDIVMQHAMDAAAHKARYAAECPHCHSHYTVKGIKTHLSRSRYCSQQETRRLSNGDGVVDVDQRTTGGS